MLDKCLTRPSPKFVNALAEDERTYPGTLHLHVLFKELLIRRVGEFGGGTCQALVKHLSSTCQALVKDVSSTCQGVVETVRWWCETSFVYKIKMQYPF